MRLAFFLPTVRAVAVSHDTLLENFPTFHFRCDEAQKDEYLGMWTSSPPTHSTQLELSYA